MYFNLKQDSHIIQKLNHYSVGVSPPGTVPPPLKEG